LALSLPLHIIPALINKMKKIFLTLLISVFAISTYAQDTSKAKKDIPSIKIKDVNGKEVDIQALTGNGKPVIFSFWATWCSPCKKELENINEVIDDWKKKYNVEIVAISIDDARNAMKVKPYVDGKKWDFPVLLDINQDVKRNLNIPNVPYTLLIDKNGKIVYRHVGYTEGDEQVLEAKLAALGK
jgi:cytochrome c biogenesis protein CcmG, thiol:disulfide interchange protein DsbE